MSAAFVRKSPASQEIFKRISSQSIAGTQRRVWRRRSLLRQTHNKNDRVSETISIRIFKAEEDCALHFGKEIDEAQSTVAEHSLMLLFSSVTSPLISGLNGHI